MKIKPSFCLQISLFCVTVFLHGAPQKGNEITLFNNTRALFVVFFEKHENNSVAIPSRDFATVTPNQDSSKLIIACLDKQEVKPLFFEEIEKHRHLTIEETKTGFLVRSLLKRKIDSKI